MRGLTVMAAVEAGDVQQTMHERNPIQVAEAGALFERALEKEKGQVMLWLGDEVIRDQPVPEPRGACRLDARGCELDGLQAVHLVRRLPWLDKLLPVWTGHVFCRCCCAAECP